VGANRLSGRPKSDPAGLVRAEILRRLRRGPATASELARHLYGFADPSELSCVYVQIHLLRRDGYDISRPVRGKCYILNEN